MARIPRGSKQRVELGAGKGRLSQELLRVLDGPQLHSPPSLPPHCASGLQSIVGCVGRASSWEEGIADFGKQRKAWFKIALLVIPIPASLFAKSVKNQLIQLRIQEGGMCACGGVSEG